MPDITKKTVEKARLTFRVGEKLHAQASQRASSQGGLSASHYIQLQHHPVTCRLFEGRGVGAMSWAAEEFKDIDLGDRRLDKRAVLLAERMAARYAHARQWARMHRTIKRQGTIVGRLLYSCSAVTPALRSQ